MLITQSESNPAHPRIQWLRRLKLNNFFIRRFCSFGRLSFSLLVAIWHGGYETIWRTILKLNVHVCLPFHVWQFRCNKRVAKTPHSTDGNHVSTTCFEHKGSAVKCFYPFFGIGSCIVVCHWQSEGLQSINNLVRVIDVHESINLSMGWFFKTSDSKMFCSKFMLANLSKGIFDRNGCFQPWSVVNWKHI